MSRWPIVVYGSVADAMAAQGVSSFFNLKVGTCYPVPRPEDYADELGARYAAIAEQRPPIIIVLPGKTFWCPDRRAYSGDQGFHGEAWEVHGYPDNLTCSPSINAVGVYHGYVQNGFVTEDCEGRRFNDDGSPA